MSKAKYVDGFVLVVPKKNLRQYKKMAKDASQIWMKHGALSYMECRGEDLSPNMGECGKMPFPKLCKLKDDETVWYSYIEFKNKAHRNSVNKKVMKDMMDKAKDAPQDDEMPWDVKRFSWGGFQVEVSA